MKIAIPDMISNSYFPAIAAVELGFFKAEGIDVQLELIFPVNKTLEVLRDEACSAVSVMVIVDDETLLHHRLRDAALFKQFERGGMDRRRARVVENLVAAFEEDEWNAATRKQKRRRIADGTCACDENRIVRHMTCNLQ